MEFEKDKVIYTLLFINSINNELHPNDKERFKYLSTLYKASYASFGKRLRWELKKDGLIDIEYNEFWQDENGNAFGGEEKRYVVRPAGHELLRNPAMMSESISEVERQKKDRKTRKRANTSLIISGAVLLWEIIKQIFLQHQ